MESPFPPPCSDCKTLIPIQSLRQHRSCFVTLITPDSLMVCFHSGSLIRLSPVLFLKGHKVVCVSVCLSVCLGLTSYDNTLFRKFSLFLGSLSIRICHQLSTKLSAINHQQGVLDSKNMILTLGMSHEVIFLNTDSTSQEDSSKRTLPVRALVFMRVSRISPQYGFYELYVSRDS